MDLLDVLSLIIFLIIGILSLFPVVNLLNKYRKSGIREFELFAIMLLTNSLNFGLFFVAYLTDNYLLWKIREIIQELTLFLILLHSVRLVWLNPPKIITGFFFGWFLFLSVIIVQWKEIPVQEHPIVLLWRMNSRGYIMKNYDLGYQLQNGTVIYSLNHTLISDFGFFIIAIVLTLSYFSVDLPNPTPDLLRAYLYMKLTVLSVLTSASFALFLTGKYRATCIGSLLLIAFIFMNYVSVKYPEVMLISHAQVMRAITFYPKVKETIAGKVNQIMDIPSLRNYIQNLPPSITQNIKNRNS